MTETSTTSTQHEALRTIADLLAQHPDLPGPYITCGAYNNGTGHYWADVSWQLLNDPLDEAGQKVAAQEIVRSLGGQWSKVDHGDRMVFRQERDALQLDIVVVREAVCDRVVTGTETVTIPAVEAQPERTEVREIVEWRCQPLLADTASAAVGSGS